MDAWPSSVSLSGHVNGHNQSQMCVCTGLHLEEVLSLCCLRSSNRLVMYFLEYLPVKPCMSGTENQLKAA